MRAVEAMDVRGCWAPRQTALDEREEEKEMYDEEEATVEGKASQGSGRYSEKCTESSKMIEESERVFEACVSSGKSLLVRLLSKEDWIVIAPLHELILHCGARRDPSSEPASVRLGKRWVPVHPQFRLFLVAPRGEAPARLLSVLQFVTFDVSTAGVECFLSHVLVWSERPDLHDSRERVVSRRLQLQEALQQQERLQLQALLQEARNILRAEQQLTAVQEAQLAADSLSAKLVVCLREEADTLRQVELYRTLSAPAALLYEVTAQVTRLSRGEEDALNVRLWSVAEYSELVLQVASESPSGRTLEQRLSGVLQRLVLTVVQDGYKRLPLRRAGPLGAALALLQLRFSGNLNGLVTETLRSLVSSATTVTPSIGITSLDEPTPQGLPGWVASAWLRVCLLKKIPKFTTLEWSLINEQEQWMNAASLHSVEGVVQVAQEERSDGTAKPDSTLAKGNTELLQASEQREDKPGAGHTEEGQEFCKETSSDNATEAKGATLPGGCKLVHLDLSVAPSSWCQLSPLEALLLLLAMNPVQCHEILEELSLFVFPSLPRPLPFSSPSMIRYAKRHVSLPLRLTTAERLALPMAPLLLLEGSDGTSVAGATVWEGMAEEDVVMATAADKKDPDALEATLTSCSKEGQLLVLQQLQTCSQAILPRLCSVLHRLCSADQQNGTMYGSTEGSQAENRLRFRMVITTDASVQVPPPLLTQCSPLWLQDALSLRGALTPALEEAVTVASSWGTGQITAPGEPCLSSLLLSVSLIHALLWLWCALCPQLWRGGCPPLALTDLNLALDYLKPLFKWQQPLDLETLHLTLAQVIYGSKLSHAEDRALVAALVRTLLSLALGVRQVAAEAGEAAWKGGPGGEAEEATHAGEGDTDGGAELGMRREIRAPHDGPGLDIEQECSKELKSTAAEATKGSGNNGCEDVSGTGHFVSERLRGPQEEEVSALARERFMKRLRRELEPFFKELPCKVSDLPKLVLVHRPSTAVLCSVTSDAAGAATERLRQEAKAVSELFRRLLSTALKDHGDVCKISP